jgi:hypothetical protein
MFIYQKSHFLHLTADINCAATQSNMATDALLGTGWDLVLFPGAESSAKFPGSSIWEEILSPSTEKSTSAGRGTLFLGR